LRGKAPHSITSPRLNFLAEISSFCLQNKITPQEYLHLKIEKLPFKLGSGKGKVPYLFDGEVAETISSSLKKLIGLIKKRHEREATTSLRIYPSLSTSSSLERDVLRRHLCMRDLSIKPLEKRIAEDAIYHNPYLDAGILIGWFLQHKEVGKLIWTVKKLYLKAIEEEIKRGGETDLTFLTHLCLIAYLRTVKETLKSVNLKGFSYEKLEQAVAQVLYSMIREIQTEVFNEVRYKELTFDVTRVEYLIKGSINPLTFVAIKPTLFKNDLNPYHLDLERFEFLQLLAHEMEANFQNIEKSLWNLFDRSKRDKRWRRKLIELRSVNRFREAVFNYLKDYEDAGGSANLWLFNLFQSNKLVQSILSDGEEGKRFEADLKMLIYELSQMYGKEKTQWIIAIKNAFRSNKKRKLREKLFFSSKDEVLLQEIIEDFILYQLDDMWSGWIDESILYIGDRKGLKLKDDLEDKYARGQIYLFSTTARPILQDLTVKKEGHLFMDLRGFTQRLSRSKEITTADFMLTGFFLPVLQVVKQYSIDEGVRLNNLLGDALSFSGRIESLISLSQKVRDIFNTCTKNMQERGFLGEANELSAIEERYQREKRAIARERRAIEESIREIEMELKQKESLQPINLLKLQEKGFDSKLLHYQKEISTLTKKIANEDNINRKRILMDLKKSLLSLGEGISEQKKELMESISLIGREKLKEVFYLFCSEEREELDNLRKLLKESYDKELELTMAYEKEISSLRDDEVEYGLFISYGDAAETITFEDEFWGRVNVAIAEKINEAARGSARNQVVKRKHYFLLKNARLAKKNPNLVYPFYVFIDKSYSLSLRSDLSTKVDIALHNRNIDVAKEVVETTAALLMQDIEQGISGYGETDWEVLSPLNDIYNLGEAMSEEALQAYLRETSPYKYHFEREVKIDELHPEIQERFFFPSSVLKILISTEKMEDTLRFDIFRHVGELIFKGFETQKATAIYEIIRKDSSFYHLLGKYHLAVWYKEAREKMGVGQVAAG